MRLYRTGEAAKKLGVSKMTILRWIQSGKLKAHRIGKEYRVPESEIKRLLEGKTLDKVVIYARVSSQDQKEDLERQAEYLKNYCSSKGYQVVKILTDISSGLNENRKGLKQLFKLVENGEITKVVITYKDRLTRFGFKYLKQYFNSHGVEIEVIFDDEEKTPEKELVEDLLAIVTSFAGKLYGMRSHKKKRLVEAVKNALRDD
ncbi:MAG TPA: IS607 family transposase [Thermococcaceae archaeon]|uniref:IS element ISTsi1 orfA, putative resolvase n=1 Tax=Thermococcus sibiricus (strain DSM 12597 / MM 739) TaxID=604354 RepID=C6A0A8_THESM|nr:IS607 family transposase [Thermococcus sibiricus]ACS91089.1 IS element ISTsi1 orfA, putative resolvase [Thermococcus sibiricus MM 739]HII68228.1 IS607 family transposase [Thermococcaceae archaeon]